MAAAASLGVLLRHLPRSPHATLLGPFPWRRPQGPSALIGRFASEAETGERLSCIKKKKKGLLLREVFDSRKLAAFGTSLLIAAGEKL